MPARGMGWGVGGYSTVDRGSCAEYVLLYLKKYKKFNFFLGSNVWICAERGYIKISFQQNLEF